MPSPLDLHNGKRPPLVSLPLSRDARSLELRVRLHFTGLIFCLICTSCGVVGSTSNSPPPPPVVVTVSPVSAKPFPGGQVQFQATVENASSSAVSWQVNGAAGGNTTVGLIDSTGLYTAPSVPPSQPTVPVTAVLQSDPTKSGSASVTIQSLSAYTGPLVISPALSSVTTSQSLQLQILTPGISNSDVSWTATGGAISASGLFTPPSTPGAYIIIASLGNATKSATVEVTGFAGALTWRNDNMRSGANSQELALSPGMVNSSTFGKLFSCPIDGFAYAQPLYVANLAIPGNGTHNVIFVATEMDSVFAFDADAKPCVQLWKTSLIPAGSQAIATPNINITSTDLVPFVGITGTPVIAASASLLYVVAATQSGSANPFYDQRLYALDLATGQPEILPLGAGISSPASLRQGRPTISFPQLKTKGPLCSWTTETFSSLTVPTAAWVMDITAGCFPTIRPHCNKPGLSTSRPATIREAFGRAEAVHPLIQITLFMWSRETGHSIWAGKRRIWHTATASCDSQRRVGCLLADYFSPCNEATLGASGLSVGSGAPVILPDSAGSAAQPHLLVSGSMGGSLYIVNRDNMGQYAGPCPDSPSRVQSIPVAGGPILSTPLFWNGAVYVAPGNGNLQSFSMSNGILSSAPSAGQSPEQLGPHGATPVISSNGMNNAILWLIDSSGALAATNGPAILRAYDPNNLSNEIYNSTMDAASGEPPGLAVKFTVPTVANGKVYVGTQTKLDVYGLLP